jgi:hypothetical protein
MLSQSSFSLGFGNFHFFDNKIDILFFDRHFRQLTLQSPSLGSLSGLLLT